MFSRCVASSVPRRLLVFGIPGLEIFAAVVSGRLDFRNYLQRAAVIDRFGLRAPSAGRIMECLVVPEKAGTVEDGDLELLTEELNRPHATHSFRSGIASLSAKNSYFHAGVRTPGIHEPPFGTAPSLRFAPALDAGPGWFQGAGENILLSGMQKIRMRLPTQQVLLQTTPLHVPPP